MRSLWIVALVALVLLGFWLWPADPAAPGHSARADGAASHGSERLESGRPDPPTARVDDAVRESAGVDDVGDPHASLGPRLIVLENGAPVAGAEVRCWNRARQRRLGDPLSLDELAEQVGIPGTTAADGTMAIPSELCGDGEAIEVRARSATGVGRTSLVATATGSPQIVRLEPAVTIEVDVVDARGAPVAHPAVQLLREPPTSERAQPWRSRPTDAQGRATFADLPMSAFTDLRTWVVARVAGVVPVPSAVVEPLRPGHHRATIRLPDFGLVEAQLVDDAGQPVSLPRRLEIGMPRAGGGQSGAVVASEYERLDRPIRLAVAADGHPLEVTLTANFYRSTRSVRGPGRHGEVVRIDFELDPLMPVLEGTIPSLPEGLSWPRTVFFGIGAGEEFRARGSCAHTGSALVRADGRFCLPCPTRLVGLREGLLFVSVASQPSNVRALHPLPELRAGVNHIGAVPVRVHEPVAHVRVTIEGEPVTTPPHIELVFSEGTQFPANLGGYFRDGVVAFYGHAPAAPIHVEVWDDRFQKVPRIPVVPFGPEIAIDLTPAAIVVQPIRFEGGGAWRMSAALVPIDPAAGAPEPTASDWSRASARHPEFRWDQRAPGPHRLVVAAAFHDEPVLDRRVNVEASGPQTWEPLDMTAVLGVARIRVAFDGSAPAAFAVSPVEELVDGWIEVRDGVPDPIELPVVKGGSVVLELSAEGVPPLRFTAVEGEQAVVWKTR